MAKEQQPVEIDAAEATRLAEAVRRIDTGMKALIESGLTRKALVVLLHHSTQVTMRDINAVLDGLERLGTEYLEKSK